MWEIARRPRWIGGLFLCLVIAAGFALLSQWQIGRSIDEGTVLVRETEVVLPLESLAEPQAPVTSRVAGQRVSVSGILNSDFLILPGRLNAGERGYWVIGHLIESGTDASLAVAVGWAPTLNDAQAAVAEITATEPSAVSAAVTGRYLPSESPQEDDFENGIQNAMSVAAIINQWQTEPDGVYGGYLILDESSVAALTESTTAQLAVIDSVAPSVEVRLNWLNIFYAIEWVVFAVFAVFLWFRLVRDAYQREQEDAAELN